MTPISYYKKTQTYCKTLVAQSKQNTVIILFFVS